ncbi:hypothetical protein ETB97_006809 [Aspergillus alliaceus]|uniref:Uncharacterized protein n=1 Tax=Petromyces alliaceus TaxID=209559 RepID=A0A8H6AGL6_PETAA|nr:hypothetical protein ETB97_006809 [Aspergillus burnettii]
MGISLGLNNLDNFSIGLYVQVNANMDDGCSIEVGTVHDAMRQLRQASASLEKCLKLISLGDPSRPDREAVTIMHTDNSDRNGVISLSMGNFDRDEEPDFTSAVNQLGLLVRMKLETVVDSLELNLTTIWGAICVYEQALHVASLRVCV